MTGRDIIADCDDLFENNIGENDYWINLLLSYFATGISVEANYYFLIQLINFRNKNPKWQIGIFGFLPTLTPAAQFNLLSLVLYLRCTNEVHEGL